VGTLLVLRRGFSFRTLPRDEARGVTEIVTNYDEIAHDWLARLLFCDCEVAIPSPPPEEGALLDLLVREDVAPLVYYNLIEAGRGARAHSGDDHVLT